MDSFKTLKTKREGSIISPLKKGEKPIEYDLCSDLPRPFWAPFFQNFAEANTMEPFLKGFKPDEK